MSTGYEKMRRALAQSVLSRPVTLRERLLFPMMREAFKQGFEAGYGTGHVDGQRTTALDIAARVRANCTVPSEVAVPGGDAVVCAVADWIENPPEWVNAPWRGPSSSDASKGTDHA